MGDGRGASDGPDIVAVLRERAQWCNDRRDRAFADIAHTLDRLGGPREGESRASYFKDEQYDAWMNEANVCNAAATEIERLRAVEKHARRIDQFIQDDELIPLRLIADLREALRD